MQQASVLGCWKENMINFYVTNPITLPWKRKRIALMWGSNCYTDSGVVKGVLSEGSSHSGVCRGPCSAALDCCCYALCYLLVNQLFQVKFLNSSSLVLEGTVFAVGSCLYVLLSCSTHEVEKPSVDKENQLDVTFCILYFSCNSCSSCFGQPCAHHQELTTAWCYSLVLVCAVAAGRLLRLLYSLFLF